ncbi:IS1595 family transposase [Rhizobium leguminosarum]|uniref:IS1595 family transposase n=1 Tax=Rhizobium leguminosarum TaxID=384 RepID=UPI001039B3E7|nr:IS1595 family transposase [Rhizobium leguminosarum bv. viciae]
MGRLRSRLENIQHDAKRIVNINRESLHAFIRDNTAVDSLLVTDGNTAYRRLKDRGHQAINLSAEDAPPAHEVLPWVHRLFANFKRWSCGTYHGVRDKHVEIYPNEFVFRWNRRRHFQTNVDTILGLGQRIGQATCRDIVGDTGTGSWRTRIRFSPWSSPIGSTARRTTPWSTVATSSMPLMKFGETRRGGNTVEGVRDVPHCHRGD